MTNAVFFVTFRNRRMLLRVYGVGCDQILDRANELRWLSRLSQLGLGPRLLGTFDNGRFEEYLDSTTLTHADLRDPELSCSIASRLCQLHTTVIKAYPAPSTVALQIWKNVGRWSEAIGQFQETDHSWVSRFQALDLTLLRKEITTCKAILNTLSSPIVFAHNDVRLSNLNKQKVKTSLLLNLFQTQYGNILKLKTTGELVVIDFEYAGYNPRGYDIANHFCEWMYDYHADEPASMHPDRFPTVIEQRRFLQAYLDATQDNETTVDALLKETSAWIMASHLYWGLWGLIQANQSEIDFDYFSYSVQRLTAFRASLAQWIP
ncbi:hypothetical protein DFQ30_005854 [Apophysomyces sp. BC1015]|nr:hypothetical protein DFQ30_005854 [Apophysomyces sp. BC1015]